MKRLNTDYIDLYQIHWPDNETPHEETVAALDDLVRAGKIRYFGWSNYNADMIGQCARISAEMGLNRAISLQSRYNMLERHLEQREVPQCREDGLGLIPFSPLAQGLLTDRYLDGIPEGSRASRAESLDPAWVTDALRERVRALDAIARERGQSLAQMALAWTLRDTRVTSTLIGASSLEQLEANVATLDNLAFTEDELTAIESVLT